MLGQLGRLNKMTFKATSFEVRRQSLLHFLIVGLASLTYISDPVDVVWALIRGHASSAMLERLVFGLGALLFLSAAALETWRHVYLFPRMLTVLAVGLLLPLPGVILLLAGEAVLISRLMLRGPGSVPEEGLGSSAALKWGLAVSMVVFVWTLQDRLAEVGVAASLLVALVARFNAVQRRSGSDRTLS